MLLNEIKGLVKREVTLEWRQKYALSGILLYVISTVYLCNLSFNKIIDTNTWNALFWVILLFASVSAVSKSFIQEREGRLLYLYSITSPQGLILSKIIYNSGLVIIMSLICLIFYSGFIGYLVQNFWLFLTALLLGSFGFSAILTLMSAISSKTRGNQTLMAILSFPIQLPLLLSLIALSKKAIEGEVLANSYDLVVILLGIDLIVVVLSYLLFPYLWRD